MDYSGARSAAMNFSVGGLPLKSVDAVGVCSASLLELSEAVLSRKASFRFEARGWSMLPAIRDGDFITISPKPGSPLGIGEIVAFVSPCTGKMVVHRIIGHRGEGYLIKGDRLFDPDGCILKEKVLGCVTKLERKGRELRLASGWKRNVLVFLSKTNVFYWLFEIWQRIPLPVRRFFYRG